MRKKMEMVTSQQSKTFEKGFEEFILFCKVKNLSPATIKFYESMVNYIFYKFYDSKGFIGDITSETVNDFILFCRESMNENDTTINTNVRALRVVLYYFMKLGYMQEFKIHAVKGTKEIIETYTNSELKILLIKPDVKNCNYIEYRCWVIVNFLLGLGCRASTLINVKISDLDFENDLVKFCHTKNRSQQLMPMSISLKEVLIEYLQYRRGAESDYLFVNAYGDFLTTDKLSHGLANYNKKRGVMKTGTHRYRHTFAKIWILNNGSVFKLQKILGHSSLDVVKNYVNMFTNDLQKDFNDYSPLESLKDVKTHIRMSK